MADVADGQSKKKEIYTWEARWTAYTMAWCKSTDTVNKFKIAVGSYKEEYSNQLSIIQLKDTADVGAGGAMQQGTTTTASSDVDTDRKFEKIAEVEHPYPATKVMWAPAQANEQASSGTGQVRTRELLATTGDYLRLWSCNEDDQLEMLSVLNNNKNTEYCAPLTSFDWNETDPSIIGTCSIDTTCTIWDMNAKEPKTQLIAHDKEVYDIAFAYGRNVFGTVGADGSLRMFDLRSLEHSTILYEDPKLNPLLRLVWNKQDPNYLATVLTDSSTAIILDIRVPSVPVAELVGHHAAINGIAWAPHSSLHICTCSDDQQALIWDLTGAPKVIDEPILAYSADAEINQVQWSSSHKDWVAIAFDNSVQILRV